MAHGVLRPLRIAQTARRIDGKRLRTGGNFRPSFASKLMKGQCVPAPATAIQFEDGLLVEQAQQGDMAAFGQLVAKYQDKVFNTCWRISGSRDAAADLTQDVFCKSLEALGRFQGKSRFYTWVYRIAVNESLSHRRKAGRMISMGSDDGNPNAIENQASTLVRQTSGQNPVDPQKAAQTRETQALVTAALDDLDDDYRAAVVLRDIEGLDYAEIAEVLGIPPGTVKSRLHRGRTALRERLERVLTGPE